MAPMRTLSQSSSVFGARSTKPLLVTVVPTASKMLSATGSIMYFINSLTETTGFMSPHSGAARAGWAGGFPLEAVGAGCFEEHEDHSAISNAGPASTTRRRPVLMKRHFTRCADQQVVRAIISRTELR